MFEARPLKLLFRRKPEPLEVSALESREQGCNDWKEASLEGGN